MPMDLVFAFIHKSSTIILCLIPKLKSPAEPNLSLSRLALSISISSSTFLDQSPANISKTLICKTKLSVFASKSSISHCHISIYGLTIFPLKCLSPCWLSLPFHPRELTNAFLLNLLTHLFTLHSHTVPIHLSHCCTRSCRTLWALERRRDFVLRCMGRFPEQSDHGRDMIQIIVFRDTPWSKL